MTRLPVYRATIEPQWIDFNGHVRDAYYGLVASYAVDAVMDHLGMGAEYRERTHGTLYTLEFHIHYLREVKQSDDLSVHSGVLDFDKKRIHLACRFDSSRLAGSAAATAEFMLLHVHQGATVSAASMPEETLAALGSLKSSALEADEFAPHSRQLTLRRG